MAKAKLGSGARFKKLQNSVAAGYEKKGMSAEKARAIGAAVAAKQGRKKYGKARFQKMAAKGRSKHPADTKNKRANMNKEL